MFICVYPRPKLTSSATCQTGSGSDSAFSRIPSIPLHCDSASPAERSPSRPSRDSQRIFQQTRCQGQRFRCQRKIETSAFLQSRNFLFAPGDSDAHVSLIPSAAGSRRLRPLQAEYPLLYPPRRSMISASSAGVFWIFLRISRESSSARAAALRIHRNSRLRARASRSRRIS